jgi:hypothetical protein
MLENLAKATDKYEATIAMQPEAARPVSAHANKNRDPNTSAKSSW